MGAILFAMLGGHLVGALIFVSTYRLVMTGREGSKEWKVLLSRSLFHSAPWLILATGFFSYHARGEAWAPWFYGSILVTFALLGTILVHAAKRTPPKPETPPNAG